MTINFLIFSAILWAVSRDCVKYQQKYNNAIESQLVSITADVRFFFQFWHRGTTTTRINESG